MPAKTAGKRRRRGARAPAVARGPDVEGFLRWFAGLIKGQPGNDEILRMVRSGKTARDLEEMGVREVGAVLCCTGTECRRVKVAGDLSYVGEAEAACPGQPVVMIHSHPGGAAVPSAGDFRDLARLEAEGRLPRLYCVARRGSRGVVVVCMDLSRGLPEGAEYLSLEETINLVEWLDEETLEIQDPGSPVPSYTTIMSEETASDVEDAFLWQAREAGVRARRIVLR